MNGVSLLCLMRTVLSWSALAVKHTSSFILFSSLLFRSSISVPSIGLVESSRRRNRGKGAKWPLRVEISFYRAGEGSPGGSSGEGFR